MSPVTAPKIPSRLSDTQVLKILRSEDDDFGYVNNMKEVTRLPDQVLSDWLNISVKTFRTYKQPSSELKDNLKEQMILLISLFNYGKEIFGDSETLMAWLKQENFFFDYAKPIDFLNTITGIRFVHDRMTALEYGDNV